MLHIKSNNDPVVGVDSRSGTARVLGELEFLAGVHTFEVSPNLSTNLKFADKWSSLVNSYIGGQVDANNVLDSTKCLTVMSFNGTGDIILPENSEHNMSYYSQNGYNLKLKRNNEPHLRETDAFSVRVAHRIHAPIGDNTSVNRTATFRTATVEDESVLSYLFKPRSFVNSGWDYIQFIDQNGNQIDRTNISGSNPINGDFSTNWVNFNQQTWTKDGLKYHVHDCYLKKVGTNLQLSKAVVFFTNSGCWEITFDSKIALAYRNLMPGKLLRIRFVFVVSPFAPEGNALDIPSTYVPSLKLARPSKLISSTFSEDGISGTFKFNRQCYVSAYNNGVQFTDKVLTTVDGEITVNFGRDVKEGSAIELRVCTAYPQTEVTLFKVDVADTIAPPQVTASIFLETRIFGSGGTPGDFAVAVRDDIEIGRVEISPTSEFLMTLNPGVTIVTGDLIELYAMDTAGNKSQSELYEVEVSITSEGAFQPNLGNDSLTSITTIS